MLNEHGIKCVSLNELAMKLGIIDNGIIDIDELKKHNIDADVVEGHYSHLLSCDLVIILCNDVDELKKRMKLRGYPESKINENIDAMLADTIYYESLDRLPAGRIIKLNAYNMSVDDLLKNIIELINSFK